jgi:hypothetical protein
MIEFARFVYEAFLPSIALGVVLGLAWRYVPVGRLRTRNLSMGMRHLGARD